MKSQDILRVGLIPAGSSKNLVDPEFTDLGDLFIIIAKIKRRDYTRP
jgi:hypothetical protein